MVLAAFQAGLQEHAIIAEQRLLELCAPLSASSEGPAGRAGQLSRAFDAGVHAVSPVVEEVDTDEDDDVCFVARRRLARF
eukprot:g32562.t1